VLIIEGKADVNQKRKLGFIAPIVLGAALGYAGIVETLVQHGAPVNTRITGGMTALHHAAAEGNVDVIETLLRYHANVNDADDMANTPLLLAARGKHLEAMRVLIEHGANTDCKNKLGQNIWDFVVDSEDRAFLESGLYLYRREKQLDNNGRITFEGAKGPMHVATAREDVGLLNALIAMGVDCKSTDQNGNTFYHQAARDNCITVLRELLEKADVNAQNIDGDTALLMACKNGSSDAVAFLLPKSNLEKKNRSGETALHVAARSELASVELVQKLVNVIVKASNWSLLDEPDKRGNTALHAAIRADRVDIIRALNNLNPRAINDMMECPLHIAAASGTANLLEEILDVFSDPSKGLNIDQRDGHGQTALHICALRGDSLRVELLIERGADLMAKDTDGPDSGNTVLHALALKNATDPMFATKGLIEVLDSILFKATVWWCMRNDRACPDVNSELYNDYTREAVFHLTTKVYNSMKMSVLCYAAKVGAIDMLNHLLNADGVYRVSANRFLTYDITGLTPETMPTDDEELSSRTKLNHSISNNSAKVKPLGFDNNNDKKALMAASPDLTEAGEQEDER
jgi:ankyrin repeat protein